MSPQIHYYLPLQGLGQPEEIGTYMVFQIHKKKRFILPNSLFPIKIS